jgi:hypothetical protein
MFPPDVARGEGTYMIFLLDALMLCWFWDLSEVKILCVSIWIAEVVSSWCCDSNEEFYNIFVRWADVVIILRFQWDEDIVC